MSSHVLWAAMIIAAYAVGACFAHTYIISKAKKDSLLISYCFLTAALLLWSAVKLLQIVSPTDLIRENNIRVQYGLALLLIASLIALLTIVYRKKYLTRRRFMLHLLGIIAFAGLLVYYFTIISTIASAFFLMLLLTMTTLCLYLLRRFIFPEMEISLDNLIEKGKDRVAVFDLNGNLVDMNLMALSERLVVDDAATLDSFIKSINRPLTGDVLDGLQIAALSAEHPSYEQEIRLGEGKDEFYFVLTAQCIKNKKGQKLGTVCLIRDITESKKISIELDRRNSELQQLNNELKAYLKIADSLEEEKERSQITREINNTIGQKLTEILSVLEVVKLTGGQDGEKLEKPLDEAIESCREVLSEIRIVVSRLVPEKNKGGN
jgi:signal transduction histidine kinase